MCRRYGFVDEGTLHGKKRSACVRRMGCPRPFRSPGNIPRMPSQLSPYPSLGFGRLAGAMQVPEDSLMRPGPLGIHPTPVSGSAPMPWSGCPRSGFVVSYSCSMIGGAGKHSLFPPITRINSSFPLALGDQWRISSAQCAYGTSYEEEIPHNMAVGR